MDIYPIRKSYRGSSFRKSSDILAVKQWSMTDLHEGNWNHQVVLLSWLISAFQTDNLCASLSYILYQTSYIMHGLNEWADQLKRSGWKKNYFQWWNDASWTRFNDSVHLNVAWHDLQFLKRCISLHAGVGLCLLCAREVHLFCHVKPWGHEGVQNNKNTSHH